MTNKTAKFDFELFFSALADRTRLRLINLMGEDEVCVCFFVEILGVNQPKISRHLAYLKRAGLVGARRDGNWMHYRLIEPPDDGATRIFLEVRSVLAGDAEMLEDRKRLVNVCCAPELPANVQGAPIPAGLVAYRCTTAC